MELSANYQKISELIERSTALAEHLVMDEKIDRLEEVRLELENPEIWSNPEKAQSLGKEKVELENLCESFSYSSSILTDAKELLEMAEAENDVITITDIFKIHTTRHQKRDQHVHRKKCNSFKIINKKIKTRQSIL